MNRLSIVNGKYHIDGNPVILVGADSPETFFGNRPQFNGLLGKMEQIDKMASYGCNYMSSVIINYPQGDGQDTKPFTDTTFSTLDQTFFDHVYSVIAYANAKNIVFQIKLSESENWNMLSEAQWKALYDKCALEFGDLMIVWNIGEEFGGLTPPYQVAEANKRATYLKSLLPTAPIVIHNAPATFALWDMIDGSVFTGFSLQEPAIFFTSTNNWITQMKNKHPHWAITWDEQSGGTEIQWSGVKAGFIKALGEGLAGIGLYFQSVDQSLYDFAAKESYYNEISLLAGNSTPPPPPPPIGSVYIEDNGYVVVEGGSLTSVGKWTFQTTIPGYTSTGYIEHGSGDTAVTLVAPTDIISFNAEVTGGEYMLCIHNWHPLGPGGNAGDFNDIWIRCLTDTNGGVTSFVKHYSSIALAWNMFGSIETIGQISPLNDPNARFHLPAGTHTIEIAGRSNQFAINKVALVKVTNNDIAANLILRDAVPTMPESLTTGSPTPINCQVSAWSTWGPCISGFEERERTIITPASNGGTPCPILIETRPCGIVPPPDPIDHEHPKADTTVLRKSYLYQLGKNKGNPNRLYWVKHSVTGVLGGGGMFYFDKNINVDIKGVTFRDNTNTGRFIRQSTSHNLNSNFPYDCFVNAQDVLNLSMTLTQLNITLIEAQYVFGPSANLNLTLEENILT
jgi:hypothetical protein